MDNKNLAMTIDFGTQSVRTMIFDTKGNILSFEQEKYDQPYFSLERNWAEQDPYYYWEKMKLTTQRTAQKRPELMQNVVGLTLTCFRDSPVILDENYKPLRPAILWLDQRRVKKLKPQPFWKNLILVLSACQVLSIIIVLKRHPIGLKKTNQSYGKTRYYVNISNSLIIY